MCLKIFWFIQLFLWIPRSVPKVVCWINRDLLSEWCSHFLNSYLFCVEHCVFCLVIVFTSFFSSSYFLMEYIFCRNLYKPSELTMASLTNFGSDVIERTLEKDIAQESTQNLEEVYEVSRCVRWIQDGGYKKVRYT